MDYFKVLIADDEENIRNGLKCIIDWESLGYKIIGECSNGKDAVNQIIDLQPDLVVLDIKMPGLTGLEVLSQVSAYFEKNNLLFPAFIILSGYSDFSYAQTAINYGAKSYLLKPVDEEELQSKVESLREEINSKKQYKKSEKNIKTLEAKEIVRKLILSNEKIKDDELLQSSFFNDYESSMFQVIIFSLEYCNNINKAEVENSILNYFCFFSFITLTSDNKIILILKTTNTIAVKNCVERSARLNTNRTFITVGDNLKGIEGLVSSYKQANNLVPKLYFISKEPFINNNFEIPQVIDYTRNDLLKYIEKIIFSIEIYDKNNLLEIESELEKLFYNLKKSSTEVKKDMIFCLVEMRNQLITKYPERDISDGKTFDVVSEILEKNTFEEAYTYFKNVLSNFIENFNFNTSDSVIIKVIAYIKSNYASDLKLETLGDLFNCNSAYLGKKFKKYTGVQFNSYLDNIRIEVAKDKLLNSDLKIYQISKLVGYANTDYFFMKFKKTTGVTPKEFKKQVEDEKNNI